MDRDVFADRDTILECLSAIEAASARLASCSFDGLSAPELMEVLVRRESLAWRAPVVDHRILARLVTDGDPGVLGASSLAKALAERLRISTAEARRRLAEAAELGPRTALTGEPLEPVLPALAAGVADGSIGPEHLAIARKAIAKLPAALPLADRERVDTDLAVLAGEFAPETFARLADHLVAVLNRDEQFTEQQRLARRGVRLGRQDADGMSTLSGKITPELRATLEPLLAKLAAPGMCNADDEQPCVAGTPSQEQIQRDHRRTDQRTHDALLATARAAVAAGDLGQLNGLPVTVIVTTTLDELHAAAGHPPMTAERITGKALTAGGTLLPMRDLLRMAEHAYHYLSVFDGDGRALWLGRAKRVASADQRIVLHARDRGCTRPGCTVSGYLSQAHHIEHDWAGGGRTDVDALAPACAPDNRMASEQGWVTRLGPSGRVEWIPPPNLERGQPRTNPYHFIEAIITKIRSRPPDPAEEQPPAPNPDGFRDDQPCPGDWPWPDDQPWPDGPVPGGFDYDAALDELYRSYDAIDLEEPHYIPDDGIPGPPPW